MSDGATRSIRGIQQSLIPFPSRDLTPIEPKGVVYTKRWVVELLLDLAGYKAERNLVDALAIEPAAGDGAFLRPMIERLPDSCKRLQRPLTDCMRSLVAYELDHASAARARALSASILLEHGVNYDLAGFCLKIAARSRLPYEIRNRTSRSTRYLVRHLTVSAMRCWAGVWCWNACIARRASSRQRTHKKRKSLSLPKI